MKGATRSTRPGRRKHWTERSETRTVERVGAFRRFAVAVTVTVAGAFTLSAVAVQFPL